MIKKVFFVFVLGFSLTMNALMVNEILALRKIRDGLANELKRQILLRVEDKIKEEMERTLPPRINQPQDPRIVML
jgi:hypothetical protein